MPSKITKGRGRISTSDNIMATYHLWKDKSSNYYWTIKSDKNGKIIAMSSEAYDSKQGAKDSIEWVRTNAKDAAFEDHTLL